MKKERNGSNRYYFTLGTDIVSWNDNPASKLFLLQHEFPMELEEPGLDEDDRSEIVRRMFTWNMLTFIRYEAALGEKRKDERSIQG